MNYYVTINRKNKQLISIKCNNINEAHMIKDILSMLNGFYFAYEKIRIRKIPYSSGHGYYSIQMNYDKIKYMAIDLATYISKDHNS